MSNAHTPVHTAEIWRKNIFLFPESIFIIQLGLLINLLHYISVFACLKGRHLALCLYLPS